MIFLRLFFNIPDMICLSYLVYRFARRIWKGLKKKALLVAVVRLLIPWSKEEKLKCVQWILAHSSIQIE